MRDGLYAFAMPLSVAVLGFLTFLAYWHDLPTLFWMFAYAFVLVPSGILLAALLVMSRAERRKALEWCRDARLELMKLSALTVTAGSAVGLFFMTVVLYDVGRNPSGFGDALILTGVLSGMILVGHYGGIVGLKEQGTGVERIVTHKIVDLLERMQGEAGSNSVRDVRTVRNPLTRKIAKVDLHTPHGTIRLWRTGRSRTTVVLLGSDWHALAETFERVFRSHGK